MLLNCEYPNLVEVSIGFPDVNPLPRKLRVPEPTELALDVEELAHIPGSKEERSRPRVTIVLKKLKDHERTPLFFFLCNHTHQSEWRICILSRAPSPGARLRPDQVRPETCRLHPPFSAQQNINVLVTRNSVPWSDRAVFFNHWDLNRPRF